MSIPNTVRFLFVGLNEEKSFKRKTDIRDELLGCFLDAAASTQESKDQLRRTKCILRTRVAKCTEVDSGIFGC
jgi:hypothetical protein